MSSTQSPIYQYTHEAHRVGRSISQETSSSNNSSSTNDSNGNTENGYQTLVNTRGESQIIAPTTTHVAKLPGQKYYCCAVVFLCINLIISLGSIGLNVFFTFAKIDNNEDKDEAKNIECVSCDWLEFNDEFRRIKSKNLCCADNAAQFQQMISQLVQKTITEQQSNVPICRLVGNQTATANHCTATRKPSAHLVGTKQNLPSTLQLQNEHPVKNWRINSNLAFIEGATFNPSTGRLIVTTPGRYIIYSHMTFMEYFKHPISTKRKRFISHSIYRYNRIYPNGGHEKLMQERQTKCFSKEKDFEFHSSHLTGMFKLRRGDQLYVKVCNISNLSHNTKDTYFGMFMI